MFWSSLTAEINGLSKKKSDITEMVCSGTPPEMSSFVAEAKQLILCSSHLVDTVLLSASANEIPEDRLKALRSLARSYSKDTIQFVHAARGFLCDSEHTKDRFSESSRLLDDCLEVLLDMVLDLMAQFPFVGSPHSAVAVAPIAVTAMASPTPLSFSSLPVSSSSVRSASPRRPAPPPPIHSIASFSSDLSSPSASRYLFALGDVVCFFFFF
jgi:hypothetical protein